MTKGTYSVVHQSDPPVGSKYDSSFKSCLCSMLVFVAICLIVLLASISWGGKPKSGPVQTKNDQTGYDHLKDNDRQRTTSNLEDKKYEEFYTTPVTTEKRKPTTINIKQTPVITTTMGTTSEKYTEQFTVNLRSGQIESTTTKGTTIHNGGDEISSTVLPKNDSELTTEQEGTIAEIGNETYIETKAESSSLSISLLVDSTTEDYSEKGFNTSNETTEASGLLTSPWDKNTTDDYTTKMETIVSSTLDTSTDKEIIENVTIGLSSITSITSTTPSYQNHTTQKTASTTLTVLEKLKDNDICTTPSCNLEASNMLYSMNHSANPCEDFYEYSCGGVRSKKEEIETTEELSQYITQENIYKFVQDFHTFYQSCVKHEDTFEYSKRLQKVRDIVGRVGQFHHQKDANSSFGETSESAVNLTDLFTKLVLHQAMPLFDVSIDVDGVSSDYVLQLTIPENSRFRLKHQWSALEDNKRRCLQKLKGYVFETYLNLTSVYEKYTKCRRNYMIYIESIENSLRELGIFANLTEAEMAHHIQTIRMSIEIHILNYLEELPSAGKIRKVIVNGEHKTYKVSELQAKYPILEWEVFLRGLTGRNIDKDTSVQVYFDHYFARVFGAIGKLDKTTLANAFLSMLVNDLFENMVMPVHKHNRAEYCLQLATDLMPDITNYFFKASYPQDELDEKNKGIEQLFQLLRAKFSASLAQEKWLDDATQISMVGKLNRLKLTFFDKGNIEREREKLSSVYKDLFLAKTDFENNLISVMFHKRKRMYSLVGVKNSPVNLFRYFISPASTEPLSFFSNDEITIPLGLTRRYSVDVPGYVTLSQVGFVLAKQIAKHFDPSGIKHNVSLAPKAKQSYTSFRDNTRDLLSLGSPRVFGDKNVSFIVDASLSTNERISDNAAFKLISSLEYYGSQQLLPWISSTFSREKVFFIKNAQEFCEDNTILNFMVKAFESETLPAVLRVENIMSNSPDFSNTFNCPQGMGMNLFEEKLQFPHLAPSDDYEEDNSQDDEALYRN